MNKQLSQLKNELKQIEEDLNLQLYFHDCYCDGLRISSKGFKAAYAQVNLKNHCIWLEDIEIMKNILAKANWKATYFSIIEDGNLKLNLTKWLK